jgi:hypothetical protein
MKDKNYINLVCGIVFTILFFGSIIYMQSFHSKIVLGNCYDERNSRIIGVSCEVTQLDAPYGVGIIFLVICFFYMFYFLIKYMIG